MKNLKPIQIVFYASVLVTILTWAGLFLLTFLDVELSVKIILLIGLMVCTFSFIVFYFTIERFIYSRIKLIYRAIRKGKITADTDFKISMRKNILARVSNETVQYLEEHNSEISKLKEQEAFRREFLGNLAHELKTPVFSIQGYVHTLLDGGLEDENVNRLFLERASKAVDRMTNILEDLDEITKMEVDQIELSISEFDIVELADEVIQSLEIVCAEKAISLHLNEDYSPISVRADRGKIAQVFANLIRNAIVYGKEKGEIQLRFHEMGDVILVEVADNGPGIEEKFIPRLFERFYRVEKSRNRNEGGSGLGLAIVKHIIEAHEQTIHVRSTVNVGSTFSFTLEKA